MEQELLLRGRQYLTEVVRQESSKKQKLINLDCTSKSLDNKQLVIGDLTKRLPYASDSKRARDSNGELSADSALLIAEEGQSKQVRENIMFFMTSL